MSKSYLTILVAIMFPSIAFGTFTGSSCDTLLVMSEQYRSFDDQTLKYLDYDELEKVRLNLKEGRLRSLDGNLFSSPYVLNLVISKEGDIFAFSGKDFDRAVRHSSPVQGAPVIFAGEVVIFNGLFDMLSNKSGHYKTSLDALVGIIRAFENSGLDTSHTEIIFRYGQNLDQSVALGNGEDILKGNFIVPQYDRSQTHRIYQSGLDISETKFRSHRPLYASRRLREIDDFFRPPLEVLRALNDIIAINNSLKGHEYGQHGHIGHNSSKMGIGKLEEVDLSQKLDEVILRRSL